MNYCQSCRRHLNGTVSCPGCGAAGVAAPEGQQPLSTDWTTEVAWPERDPVAPMESHGAHSVVLGKRPAGPEADTDDSQAGAHAAEGFHAVQRPPLRGDDKSDERELVRAGDSAPGFANGHRGHRPRKRRRLGLGVTVTGGFAGIAIIGLLVLGNLPPTGGRAAAVGAITAVSTSTPQSPGAVSSSGTQTPTQTLIDSGPRSTASSNASAVSPSPGLSDTPDPSPTSAQAQQPTGPATVPPGSQSSSLATQSRRPATASSGSQPATQSTTPPPAPAPSPSPSQTQVSCFLIICW